MAQLSSAEIDQYRDSGYVVPEFTLPVATVDKLRETVDRLIRSNPDVRPEQLVNAHIANPNAEGVKGADELLELTRHPDILDLVEAVLGPDIILWGCHLFCKPAGDGMEAVSYTHLTLPTILLV